MPLSSMTGFAKVSVAVAGSAFAWELKSVNARGLDLRMRLPAGFDRLEPELRRLAREQIARGSCQISLQVEEPARRNSLVLDEDALALVLAASLRLASVEGVAPARADGILALPGVLREQTRDASDTAGADGDATLVHGFVEAVEALKTSRQEEGARLGAVLEMHLARVDQLVEAAAGMADTSVEVLKARIRDQLALLTADASPLDPERLHQEALIAATRADVREELDRLRSHVAAARQLLSSGHEVGRRLEFLAQEFNREANTLCSKAVDRRLTAIGLEMKAVIDQLREQVQNIE